MGGVVEGIIIGCSNQKIIRADIGAAAVAKVVVPESVAILERGNRLKRDEKFQMKITNIDTEKEIVDVELVDSDRLLSQWESERTPLEDYKVGQLLQGKAVLNRGGYLLIDVGARALARLVASANLTNRVTFFEPLEELEVVDIDTGRGRMGVRLYGKTLEIVQESPFASKSPPVMEEKSKDSKSKKSEQKGNTFSLDRSLGKKGEVGQFTLSGKALKANMEPEVFEIRLQNLSISDFDMASGRLTLKLDRQGNSAAAPKPPKEEGAPPGPVLPYTVAVGDLVDGKVNYLFRDNVYIAVEGQPDFKLKASPDVKVKLVWGEEISGLRVESFGEQIGEKGKLLLSEEAEAQVLERPGRRRIEEAVVGTEVDGHVAAVIKHGTLVDIGYEVTALMGGVWKKQAVGRELTGLKVKAVDLERKSVLISME